MPWGNGDLSPAICDRCGIKRPYPELRHEPASGLRVCATCFDDPGVVTRFVWQSRGYPLRHARPDVPIVTASIAPGPVTGPVAPAYTLPVNEEG